LYNSYLRIEKNVCCSFSSGGVIVYLFHYLFFFIVLRSLSFIKYHLSTRSHYLSYPLLSIFMKIRHCLGGPLEIMSITDVSFSAFIYSRLLLPPRGSIIWTPFSLLSRRDAAFDCESSMHPHLLRPKIIYYSKDSVHFINYIRIVVSLFILTCSVIISIVV
jgi:hypothetical protein